MADWVEFGLSLEVAERFASGFLEHIKMGCSLAKRLFLMRRRQFAKRLAVSLLLYAFQNGRNFAVLGQRARNVYSRHAIFYIV